MNDEIVLKPGAQPPPPAMSDEDLLTEIARSGWWSTTSIDLMFALERLEAAGRVTIVRSIPGERAGVWRVEIQR